MKNKLTRPYNTINNVTFKKHFDFGENVLDIEDKDS